MTKDKVLFHLSRHVRAVEDIAEVDLEFMAKRGMSYGERRTAVAKAEEAKPEAEALRAALECVQEHYVEKK